MAPRIYESYEQHINPHQFVTVFMSDTTSPPRFMAAVCFVEQSKLVSVVMPTLDITADCCLIPFSTSQNICGDNCRLWRFLSWWKFGPKWSLEKLCCIEGSGGGGGHRTYGWVSYFGQADSISDNPSNTTTMRRQGWTWLNLAPDAIISGSGSGPRHKESINTQGIHNS